MCFVDRGLNANRVQVWRFAFQILERAAPSCLHFGMAWQKARALARKYLYVFRGNASRACPVC